MAQVLTTDFPIDPATTSGTMLADILNRQADAIQTSNSGPTAPTETYPGLVWLDTSGGADGILKIRNGANTAWRDFIAASVSPGNSAAALAALGIPNHQLITVDGAGSLTSPATVTAAALSLAGGNPSLVQNATDALLNFATGWAWIYNKATGNMTWARSGGLPDLSFLGNGDINCNFAVNNQLNLRADFYLSEAGTYRLLNYATNWALRWNTSSGALEWLKPGVVQWSLDGVGMNLYQGAITVHAGAITAANNLNSTVGTVGLGTLGSRVDKGGYTVRDYGAAGSLVFTNILDAAPAGVQMVLSFQHNPGLYAHAQFQVGAASFEFKTDNDAQKSGGSSTWSIASDRRVKQDIVDYSGGLTEILSLTPRRFRYRNDPTREYFGIIADEAEPGMPEIIRTGYGVVDGQPVTDFKTLFIDPVIWSLVNSVKTLTARVEALEAAAAP